MGAVLNDTRIQRVTSDAPTPSKVSVTVTANLRTLMGMPKLHVVPLV